MTHIFSMWSDSHSENQRRIAYICCLPLGASVALGIHIVAGYLHSNPQTHATSVRKLHTTFFSSLLLVSLTNASRVIPNAAQSERFPSRGADALLPLSVEIVNSLSSERVRFCAIREAFASVVMSRFSDGTLNGSKVGRPHGKSKIGSSDVEFTGWHSEHLQQRGCIHS